LGSALPRLIDSLVSREDNLVAASRAPILNPREPAAVLLIAGALFAGILVLKLTVTTPGFGFALLYDIPVALVAIAFGVRGGLAAAAVGMVLFAIGDAAGEIHSNVWGYTSRALTFALLGVLLGVYSDRLRRMEAVTRESEARYRAALEHSPVVVWQQDRDLRYTWVHNPAAIFGTEDILGKTDEDLTGPGPGAPSRLKTLKQEVLRTGQGGRIEVEFGSAGASAYFDVTLNPLTDPEGEVIGLTAAATDVTALRTATEADRRLAAIVDQSEDSIIAKDADGIITEWNDGAERLYGYPPEEAIGQPITILVPPESAGEDQAVLARILDGQPPERFETTRLRKDGSTVEVWLTISPLRDAGGNIVGASSIARDIGLTKRTQRELERSYKELEQYAYVASHDLQEPLRSIGGFAKILQERYEGRLDAESDQYIGFILKSVDRLQALIDDLLTYSRSGRTELRSEPVDTRQMVESTVESLDAAVRESGAEIALGELPTVETDPQVLGQVFQNLLSNALKFTAERTPRVEVSAEHSDGSWTFAVADNGIGIDPAQADRVFEMFQRLHGRDEYGGTGIGLAISQRVVERLGGRIWCEPREGDGTVFRFTIPDPGNGDS